MLPCRMGISASPRDKTLQLLECTLGAPEVLHSPSSDLQEGIGYQVGARELEAQSILGT